MHTSTNACDAKRDSRLVAFILTALIAAACLLAIPARALAADSGGLQPMYRLYNTGTKEHFYTADSHERSVLIGRGWRNEGIGWYAPKKSSTPVYRLYNAGNRDHHYTTSKAERDYLVSRGSWTYEGVGWYSCDEKDFPLYREFHPSLRSGAHNYTTDSNEHKVLTTKRGWNDEGIGWYACLPGSASQWFAVSFNANGGTGTMHVQGIYRDKATTLDANAFKRSGYTFAGWNTKADGKGTSYKDKASVKNLAASGKTVTLYAQWKKTAAATYSVSFNANGGMGSMSKQTIARDKATALTSCAFKRSGYAFSGWNTKADGKGTSYKNKASVKNLVASGKTVTLYAQWRQINWTLKTYSSLRDASATTSTTYQVAQTGITAPSLESPEPEFLMAGWTDVKGSKQVKYAPGASLDALSKSAKEGEVKTLYPVFYNNRVKIIFIDNVPGATPRTDSYSFETYCSEAYFMGFPVATFLNASGTDLYSYGVRTTPRSRYFNHRLVSWNSRADGKGIESTQTTFMRPNPVYTRLDLRELVKPTQTYAWPAPAKSKVTLREVKVYGQWTNWEYSIGFEGNGTGVTGSMEAQWLAFKDSTTQLTANAFKRTGYSFTGWNTKADGSGTAFANKATMANQYATILNPAALVFADLQHITLYAQWKPNTYTVKFNANGGSGTMANQTLTYDKAATLRANTFTRTDYKFVGWNTQANGKGTTYKDKTSVTNLKSSGTVTLYAQWEKVKKAPEQAAPEQAVPETSLPAAPELAPEASVETPLEQQLDREAEEAAVMVDGAASADAMSDEAAGGRPAAG